MKPGTLVAYAAIGEVNVQHNPFRDTAAINMTPVLRKARVVASERVEGWAEADAYYRLSLSDGAARHSDDVVEVRE